MNQDRNDPWKSVRARSGGAPSRRGVDRNFDPGCGQPPSGRRLCWGRPIPAPIVELVRQGLVQFVVNRAGVGGEVRYLEPTQTWWSGWWPTFVESGSLLLENLKESGGRCRQNLARRLYLYEIKSEPWFDDRIDVERSLLVGVSHHDAR